MKKLTLKFVKDEGGYRAANHRTCMIWDTMCTAGPGDYFNIDTSPAYAPKVLWFIVSKKKHRKSLRIIRRMSTGFVWEIHPDDMSHDVGNSPWDEMVDHAITRKFGSNLRTLYVSCHMRQVS